MAYDGSIRINTRIDAKGFNAGVKSMMGSLGSLAAAFGVAFSVGAIVSFGKKSVETAKQMESGWQGLVYVARSHGRDINQIKKFLEDYTSDGLVPMLNAQAAYRNMIARGYDTKQLEDMLKVMKDSAVYLRKGMFDIGEAVQKTTEGLRTERSILSDTSGIEQNMYKMWQAYAKEQGTTIANLTLEQKRIAEYQGFMKEGSMYAGAAAQYTETYAGKVSKLSAAMVGLRVSVGNAFIPILNALLPAVISLVQWFTRLFNIIGRVMNLLFGTNVGAKDTEALAMATQDAADAQQNLANNTEKAGKAAKGALAPFDKLNVLSQPTGSGSGAGGADTALPGGEKVGGVAQEVDDLLQKLQEFYAKVKELFEPGGAGSLAKSISDSIVGGLQNARTAVQGFDFSGFGSDLANGFNTAVGFIDEFLNNTDFSGIGSNLGGLIGDVLKGALDTGIAFLQGVDWQNVGSTIWSGIQSALDFAWGFLEGVDWSGVVSKFFELLGSAFGAVAGIAVGLGTSIWESLKEAWATTKQKWEEFKDEAGGDIWGGIKSGIKKALENVGTWIKENIVDPFIGGFKKSFGIASPSTVMAEQGGFLIDGLKKGIEDAWKGVEKWFTETISDPIKKWFSDTWDDIKKGATDAWDGLVETWEDAKTWFKDNVTDPIKEAFDEAFKKIKEFMESPFEGLGDFVKKVFNDVIGFLNGLLIGLTDGINGIIEKLNSLNFAIPDWVPFFGGRSFGINIPLVSVPQIPYLATGAVIPPNAPFAAILGDQRSGTNVEAPLSTIEQAVENVLGRMNPLNTEDRMIHNQIKIDGQVIYDAYKRIDKRKGKSMLSGSVA